MFKWTMFDILLKYCLEKEVDNKELHGNAWKEISCTMGIDIVSLQGRST